MNGMLNILIVRLVMSSAITLMKEISIKMPSLRFYIFLAI
jgi:hypothetical protein